MNSNRSGKAHAGRSKHGGGISRAPRAGTAVIWPKGLEARYGISPITRWRWERDQKLPARDVFIAGRPIGWRPATLDRADSTGPQVA